MQTATLDSPEVVEQTLASWLTDIDAADSPAGPLYLGGEYAVQEITMTGTGNGDYNTLYAACGGGGSADTGSFTVHCC